MMKRFLLALFVVLLSVSFVYAESNATTTTSNTTCEKPVCEGAYSTGDYDANSCLIYKCPTSTGCSKPICEGVYSTGEYDANSCLIYKCPQVTCEKPVCEGVYDTGRKDSNNCVIYACPPTTNKECYETDNGQDYYKRGEITLPNGLTQADYCLSDVKLLEFSCSTGYEGWDVVYYDCPEGCLDGACKNVEERFVDARLNQKFKLAIGGLAKVSDIGMDIKFIEVVESGCEVRTVVPVPTEVSAGISGRAVYEITSSEEKSRAVEIKSDVSKCREGQLIGRLGITLNKGQTSGYGNLDIKLGEKKNALGYDITFFDYFSEYKIGVFIVTKGDNSCQKGCICNADGSQDCPPSVICKVGEELCPDGICREECKPVVLEECKFGCLSGDNCLPIGIRKEGQYCSVDRDLENQLGSGETCENDFECKTNSCLDSVCTEPGFWQNIYKWLSKIFG